MTKKYAPATNDREQGLRVASFVCSPGGLGSSETPALWNDRGADPRDGKVADKVGVVGEESLVLNESALWIDSYGLKCSICQVREVIGAPSYESRGRVSCYRLPRLSSPIPFQIRRVLYYLLLTAS